MKRFYDGHQYASCMLRPRCAPTIIGGCLLTLLVTTGCTGGGEPSSTPSTHTPKATPTIRKQEFSSEDAPQFCEAVSDKTLRKLGMRGPDIDTSLGCSWREDDDSSGDVERELTVDRRTYDPPLTRRSYTATKEARVRFSRLSGWEDVQTTPVRRLGDQAKVARHLRSSGTIEDVWLAVRERNVILEVKASNNAHLSASNGKVVPFGQLESAAVAAAGELLGKLTADRQSAPRVAGYRDGESKSAHPVCSAVKTARRLVPGISAKDTSTKGVPYARGCTWSDRDGHEQPSLDVDVQAIPPSRSTGETATQSARVLYYTNSGRKLNGLGDDAKLELDRFTFKGEESRTASVLVRKGNLLVFVEYQRWHHPSKAQVRRGAVETAKDVLKGYS